MFGYGIAAIFVVAAGVWLPFIGADLASAMEWNNSFVGTLFVAFSTSLPELAVALSALRLGALDLAIGNLLGSNLFDMAIVAVDDLAYTKAQLFEGVSEVHAGTAISAIIMTGAVIASLFYRPATRTFRVFGWTGLFLLVISRFAYVQAFPDHLRIATPFMRVNISYKRLHKTTTTEMRFLFPRNSMSGWVWDIFEPLANNSHGDRIEGVSHFVNHLAAVPLKVLFQG